MSEVLSRIFTDEILARLRKCKHYSRSAEFRHRVICSLPPVGDSAYTQQFYEQTRARWNRWVGAAISIGLFEDPYGAELKARLTGVDHDGFRSALGECMTCWALSSELGMHLRPRPSGRAGCVLEFAVQMNGSDISFEVKSPRLPSAIAHGTDPLSARATSIYSTAIAIRAALRSANRQFAAECPNVLVIAMPEAEVPARVECYENWPAALIRALYGEQRLSTVASGTSASRFVAEGNFLKRTGGVARFTRISAVIGLQEIAGEPELGAAVFHNPFSQNRVDCSIFGQWDQFGAVNGAIYSFRFGPQRGEPDILEDRHYS